VCCTLTNIAPMLNDCATDCDLLPAYLPTGTHRCWSPWTSSQETGAPHNCCYMLCMHRVCSWQRTSWDVSLLHGICT